MPSQQVSPVPHITHSPSHTPLTQALPAAHFLPQVPQLLTSVCRSAQPVPQQVWLPRQAMPVPLQLHLPVWQVSPILHGRPQPPIPLRIQRFPAGGRHEEGKLCIHRGIVADLHRKECYGHRQGGQGLGL